MPAIDKHDQKNAWMSVPQFGGWDQKAGGATDYSMVFSRARANKKQQKTEVTKSSPGIEEELMAHTRAHPRAHARAHAHAHAHAHGRAHVHSPTKRKRLLSCFSCCGKA